MRRRFLLELSSVPAFFFVAITACAQDDPPEPVLGTRTTLEFVRAGFERPVELATAPGDDRTLFVVEAAGRILALDLDGLGASPSIFLDIRGRVRCCGEQGLLGLAFHPSFAENGELFVYYTAPTTDANACRAKCDKSCVADTVVSRFRVLEDDPTAGDPSSEEILLRVGQPYENHNAGKIAFAPFDGYLYIALGDGGSGGDPCNSGQDPQSYLGKILRIDVDATSEGKPYGIPETNPFVETGTALPEIWALGLRNPWRFAFDRLTGDLFIADVGQNAWEEINWEPGGSQGGFNYEWRVREGDHGFGGGTAITVGERRKPVHEYPHSGAAFTGCSVTGGEVYRGASMPDLHGTYFFVDHCTSRAGSFRMVEGERVDLRDRTAEWNEGIRPDHTLRNVSTFGTDPQGEIWLATIRGELFRIVPASEPNGPPTAKVTRDPATSPIVLEDVEAAVALDASESTDGDGGVQDLSFLWEIVEGGDGAMIEAPEAPYTEIRFSVPGSWVVRLTVSDGGAEDAEEVALDVVSSGNAASFRRADVNADAAIDISDGVFTLLYLFADGLAPSCLDSADADDDGSVGLSDAVFILDWLFRAGSSPAGPFDACGIDPTPDDELACETQPACAL